MTILKRGDTIEKYACKCPKCGCEWLCDEHEVNLTVLIKNVERCVYVNDDVSVEMVISFEYNDSSEWSTEPIFTKTCSCPECGEEEVEAKERLIK